MQLRTVLFVAGCLVSGAVCAQAQTEVPSPIAEEPSAEPDFLERVTPQGVSLGIGVLASKGILLGESTRTYVVPTIAYEGERLFIRGISGGVHLFKRDGFEINALVALRLDGWDADDLSASELAEVGIDRELLLDRKNEFDAGFGASWRTDWGQLNLVSRADVTGESDGYEIAFIYRAAFDVWGGALVPSLGVSYWSDNLSDYYYGTLPSEVVAGVPRYRPGSAVVPNLSLAFLHAMPKNWLFAGGFQVQWLSDDILDSPLVDSGIRSGVPSVFISLSHSFGKIN